ncbi:MAG TPA: DegV family protein [Thermoflexia bacterium]|nr:DegV family protein [Thermoflexia bacterium]
MNRVAVVTDSAAALPMELVKEYHIHVVPLLLLWDDQTYRDGVDITPGEVYRRLREVRSLPTTSAPSVGDFIQVYTRLREKVESIVSIHVSSKLSAVYQAARVASEAVEGVVPVQVIDSGTAAMGQGFAVLAAARAAAGGANPEEVAREAERVSRRTKVFGMLDTLEYLRRTGRVRRAVSLAASALNIKPILCIDGRGVDLLARPRTPRKALRVMLQEMERHVGGHPVHVAVMHADAPAEAEQLRQEVAARFDCLELLVTEFTPVMGSAAGPGLVGLAFYSEDGTAE